MQYSEDNNTINVVNGDVENGLKLLIMPKKVFKMYDCFTYSILTDSLPVLSDNHVITKRKNLKTRNIISFRNFKTIDKGVDVK